MVNKLMRIFKKQESYQLKDLYVGEILCYYAQMYKKPKSVNLTIPAKSLAILTPENIKTLSFKHIKTNKILQPVEQTPVGHFALNDKSIQPLKDAYPEILKEFKLTENSKLSKSKIIKLENYLHNIKLNAIDLQL